MPLSERNSTVEILGHYDRTISPRETRVLTPSARVAQVMQLLTHHILEAGAQYALVSGVLERHPEVRDDLIPALPEDLARKLQSAAA